MSTISVIVITKNEAHDLRACLESVAWVHEIVVLDSGSTDQTLAIAREFTSLVYVNTDWQGFGIQKNRTLGYASGDWILSLDADERITPQLREEINRAITSGQYEVYSMPRLSSYCGRYIRHGGWWPDRVARLFKSGAATFSNDLVHERLIHTCNLGRLRFPILHITYQNLEEVIAKINDYSTLGARKAHAQGKRGGLWIAIAHGLWAFIRTYLLRLGFLDGGAGFMLAVSNAETSYYRYLKIHYLQQAKANKVVM